MDPCDSLSENEEELIVYVEFQDFVNRNAFSNKNLQLDMIGVDTDHPIMQINGRFYEGTYEDAIGTYMFFEKDDDQIVDDQVFDRIPKLKFFAKTRKVLKMQRVFIKQRTEVFGDSQQSSCIPNSNTIREAGVAPNYQAQALSFWNTMWHERMNALNAYLEKQRIREEKKSEGIIPDSESDEDNPFAMYKQKETFGNIKKADTMRTDISNHCNKTSITNLEIPIDTLHIAEHKTRVDLSPSTSKESKEPESSCIASRNLLRKKNVKRTCPMSKKKVKRKQIMNDTKMCNLDKSNSEVQANISSNAKLGKIIAVTQELIDNTIVNNYGDDNLKIEIDKKTSLDKKLEKQSKRDAKIKEISDRLKTVATEHSKVKVDE